MEFNAWRVLYQWSLPEALALCAIGFMCGVGILGISDG